MKTTIDSAGRIVIPKRLRARLGLTGGQAVEIRETSGRIEIEPAPTAAHLESNRSGLVAVPEEPIVSLTDEIVRDTLEKSRR